MAMGFTDEFRGLDRNHQLVVSAALRLRHSRRRITFCAVCPAGRSQNRWKVVWPGLPRATSARPPENRH